VSAFPTAIPVSRVPDPAVAPGLGWGILAPGGIARVFTNAVHRHTRQHIVAVGSRSAERAAAFAREFGVDRAYGSYLELVDDPGVDVVYVASPHSEHRAQALLAVAAGKHVLVEKAFTRNAAEAAEVVAAARAAGVVAMEAMWTRFLPQTDVIRQLLDDGTIGEVVTVLADHGQYFLPDPEHRVFNPALAGGALLDLGVYPISFASFVLGRPERIIALGSPAVTGVDAQVTAVLQHGPARPAQATVTTTLAARTPTTASISGTVARIELGGADDGPFYVPVPVNVISRTGERLVRPVDAIAGHEGLCHEAAHLAQLVADGAPESPLLPGAETVEILATIDEIRRQIGLRFPNESRPPTVT